jgi:hypothetical protein
MPTNQRFFGAADPAQLATMKAALHEAWAQVAHRFSGSTPEVVASARNAIADGILNTFQMGATDLLPLKHGGLAALRLLHSERFRPQ